MHSIVQKQYTRNYESHVTEHDMTQVNAELEKQMTQVKEKLERPIDYTEVCNILKDLVHHRSKYPDITNIIIRAMLTRDITKGNFFTN